MAYPPKTQVGAPLVIAPVNNPDADLDEQSPVNIEDAASQPKTSPGADLSKDTRAKLGDYLFLASRGASPSGKGNPFPISPVGSQEAVTSEIQTGGTNNNDQDHFASAEGSQSHMPQEVGLTLERYSNSGQFDSVSPQGTFITTELGERPGSDLFRKIKTQVPTDPGGKVAPLKDDAPLVQKKINSILKLNRFSGTENTPYIAGGDFSNKGIPEQGVLGEYKQRQNQGTNAKWGGSPTIDSLKSVASSLLLRSTGHGFSGDTSNDPTDLATITATAVPSRVQLLINKLNASELRAKNAFGAPRTTELQGAELGVGIEAPAGGPVETFGTLNSHAEPFEAGGLPMGMLTVCVTGMGALIVATTAIVFIVNFFQGSPSVPSIPDGFEGLGARLGVRSGRDPSEDEGSINAIERMFTAAGFPADITDFDAKAAIGIRVFYGLPTDLSRGLGGPGILGGASLGGLTSIFTDGAIVSSLINVIAGAGYYAGIIRHAVRDLHSFAEKITDFTSNPANLLTGAQAVVGLIMEFFQLNAVKFLLTMAKIGQARTDALEKLKSEVIPPINDLEDNAGNRLAKSRAGYKVNKEGEKEVDRRMVWRHSNLPSRYLYPTNLIAANAHLLPADIKASIGLGLKSGKFAMMGGTVAKDDQGSTNKFAKSEIQNISFMSGDRITPEYAKFIEDQLELEYCPFYFHDVRTNEFIAFNAFLDSIKENFKPEYTETSGYGRIDNVMIYKSTTRTLSLSFHLVSTSPEDHNAMWYDINKLTGLIYPQWSKGSAVSSGADNFIMPFSQLPTASPLCRIRIGDLIKSNYSKFALARLFGADLEPKSGGEYNIGTGKGPSKYEFDGVVYNTRNAANAAKVEHDRKAREDAKKVIPGALATIKVSALGGSHVSANKAHVHPGDQSARKRASTMQGTRAITSTAPVQVEVLRTYVARFRGGRTETKLECKFTIASKQLNPFPGDEKAIIHVRSTDVEILQRDIVQKEVKTIDGATPSTVKDFYDSNKNSIIKSFETGMGRGLAGFITGFDIDYEDATWDVQLGKRAPMNVRISIDFAVIHDIVPGIDHRGQTRAPIFNVGDAVAFGMGANDPHGRVLTTNKLFDHDTLVKEYLRQRSEKAKGIEGSENEPMGPGRTDFP